MPTPPSPAWFSPAPSSSAPGPPTRPPATPSLSTLRVRGRRGAGVGRAGVPAPHIPVSRSPRGRERDPGRLGTSHLQVAPVAGSVRHQLERHTGGGCMRGECGQPWVAAGRARSLNHRRSQVCAPLQHWNAMEEQQEAFRTPTGTCFVWRPGQQRTVWYSPCRGRTMASTYREWSYGEGGPGSGGCRQARVRLTLPCALSARQSLLRDRLQRRCHPGERELEGLEGLEGLGGLEYLWGDRGTAPRGAPRDAPGVLIEMQRVWPGWYLGHGGGFWGRDAEMEDAGVGIPGRVGGMLGWGCQDGSCWAGICKDGEYWGGRYLCEDALGGCQGAPGWC